MKIIDLMEYRKRKEARETAKEAEYPQWLADQIKNEMLVMSSSELEDVLRFIRDWDVKEKPWSH